MYCVTGIDGPFSVSFKVPDEEFDELSSREGFMPAPYMARNKWVNVNAHSRLKKKEWEHLVKQSYELVKARLTAKARRELKID